MKYFDVAQPVEQRAVNVKVLGSNPSVGAKFRGLSILGDAPVFQTGKPGSIPGFRSIFAALAQLAEQGSCKAQVVGAIPTGSTILALLALFTTTACGGCFGGDTNRQAGSCGTLETPVIFLAENNS